MSWTGVLDSLKGSTTDLPTTYDWKITASDGEGAQPCDPPVASCKRNLWQLCLLFEVKSQKKNMI